MLAIDLPVREAPDKELGARRHNCFAGNGSFIYIFGPTRILDHCPCSQHEKREPLKGVILFLLDPNKKSTSEVRTQEEPTLASAKTDADGAAIFQLREPLPEVVVSYGDTLFVGRCTPSLPFATAEILKTGVVGPNTCSGRKLRYTAAPKPGELVIFGKHGAGGNE